MKINLLLLCFVSALSVAAENNIPFKESADSTLVAEVQPDALMQGFVHDRSSTLEWYTMFERIPGDWVTYANDTFREDRIPQILGMVGVTAFTIWTDQPVWEASDRWYKSSKIVADISDVFVYVGDGKPQFGLAAAFGAFGYLANDQRALRTASQIVETILACGIVIQTMKHITGRESPFISTRTNGRWVFFPNQIDYHKHVPHYDAYPSGHIATTLATLTVVLENYPEWKSWLQPIGYAIVAGVGIGLSNTGIHWWSDFPLGLALGYKFGMIASHPEGLELTKSEKDNAPKLTISPNISPLGQGVTLSLQF